MPKYEVVCPVCFASHTMKAGEKITRHGFKVYNRSVGQVGNAWQTGACAGGSFPHFGKSTEGTEWALAKVKEQIAYTEDQLEKLAGNPPLEWHYTSGRYDRCPKENRPASRSLLPGAEEVRIGKYHYSPDAVVPSYDAEHKKQVNANERRLKSLEHDRKVYEEALANWKPQDPVELPEKKQVVHKSFKHRTGRTLLECGSRGMYVHHTEKEDEVTCTRCLKSLAKRVA